MKENNNIFINIILNKNNSSLKDLKLVFDYSLKKKNFKSDLLVNLSILYFITIN